MIRRVILGLHLNVTWLQVLVRFIKKQSSHWLLIYVIVKRSKNIPATLLQVLFEHTKGEKHFSADLNLQMTNIKTNEKKSATFQQLIVKGTECFFFLIKMGKKFHFYTRKSFFFPTWRLYDTDRFQKGLQMFCGGHENWYDVKIHCMCNSRVEVDMIWEREKHMYMPVCWLKLTLQTRPACKSSKGSEHLT